MKNSSIIAYYRSLFRLSDSLSPAVFRSPEGDSPEPWVLEAESHLRSLFRPQEDSYERGFSIVAGADEVGRGPCAGPVVACAVVFDKMFFLPGLNDSKKIPRNLRELICRGVEICAKSYSLGVVEAGEIDEINIHNASLLAMKRAFEGLKIEPDMLFLDGCHLIPDLPCHQEAVVGGDGKIYPVSAASVVAKVTRDAMMEEYDKIYPGYGFAAHKGYFTRQHERALSNLGATPIHRRSYAPVKKILGNDRQLKLF